MTHITACWRDWKTFIWWWCLDYVIQGGAHLLDIIALYQIPPPVGPVQWFFSWSFSHQWLFLLWWWLHCIDKALAETLTLYYHLSPEEYRILHFKTNRISLTASNWELSFGFLTPCYTRDFNVPLLHLKKQDKVGLKTKGFFCRSICAVMFSMKWFVNPKSFIHNLPILPHSRPQCDRRIDLLQVSLAFKEAAFQEDIGSGSIIV